MTNSKECKLYNILIIEDQPEIQEIIRTVLEKAGYSVSIANNGFEGINIALEKIPDLILLDHVMPVCDGLTTLKFIRESKSSLNQVPVIMLTAMSEENEILIGFDLGADDYLTKPFSTKELIARIRAVLRRYQTDISTKSSTDSNEIHIPDEIIKQGEILLNLTRHEAWVGEQQILFTRTEFNLIKTLISRPGRVFTRNKLLELIIISDNYVIDRNIDVHVRAIRRKLGKKAKLIQTVRGIGYKFIDA